jgi:acyl-CoA reductase-like NAD-dependent aldehyde dehydrogenase
VAADADLDLAATKLAANAFSFAGQSCISVQRIYVERPAIDGLPRTLSCPKVEALVVGDPADEATDVGPVIDADARTRIAEWVEEAQGAGAKLLAGSADADLLGAIVLAEAPESARVVCDEVFGPVCVVNTVDSLETPTRARTEPTTGSRRGSSPARSQRRSRPPRRSSSAVSPSTRRRPSAPTRCPTAASRDPGNTKEGPAYTIREMTEERLVVLQA